MRPVMLTKPPFTGGLALFLGRFRFRVVPSASALYSDRNARVRLRLGKLLVTAMARPGSPAASTALPPEGDG